MKRAFAIAGAALFIGCIGITAVAGCSSSTPPTDNEGGACASNQTSCSGTCVDLQKDNTNCGACGTACANGMLCSQGKCATSCGGGTVQCGMSCVDPKIDPANCGSCGNACGQGKACVGGQCSSSCGMSQTLCSTDAGSFCANTQSDNANCGTCGNKCAQGKVCANGTCASSCGQSMTQCNGDGGAYCANTQSDNANCGSCGNTCGPQQVCANGTCSSTCLMNQTLCSPDGGAPYCANTQTDNANCGSCGNTCGGQQVCTNGTCASSCVMGQTLCSPDGGAPYCANLQSDNVNCGSCGKTCGNGQSCIMGACVAQNNPASCKALKVLNPNAPSGIYQLTVNNNPLTTYCDMTTDGGGWTLVLNRLTESDNNGQLDVTSTHNAFDNNRTTNWNYDFNLFYANATEVAFAVKHNSNCSNCTIAQYDSGVKMPRQPNALTLTCNSIVSMTATKLVGPGVNQTATAYVCANSVGWGQCTNSQLCHYGIHWQNTTSDGQWSQNNNFELHFPSAYSSYKNYVNANSYCRSCGGGLQPNQFNPLSSTCCNSPNNLDNSTWTTWLR